MSTTNSPGNRYARQSQFAPIGLDGQKQIEESSIAILGCGALGTVSAEILARAGVGRISLIDRDIIEWTNLQRQSLFVEADAEEGLAKADIAARRLGEINSSLEITPHVMDVTSNNIESLLGDVDLVVDASDNFPLRFLLNDWSLSTQTAWVHGGCVGATGQIRLFDGTGKPCFRCLVEDVPPPGAVQTCDTAGVIGGATHAIASLQAIEAIKWLSGNPNTVRTKVFSIDFWNNRQREIAISDAMSANCPACGDRNFEFLHGQRDDSSDQTAVLCGRESVQIAGRLGLRLNLDDFSMRWSDIGSVQSSPFFVRLFLDNDKSVTLFRDGRAVVAGTTSISEARSLYARYVG